MNDNDFRIAWQTIDQINTAVDELRAGRLSLEGFADYVARKTQETLTTLPYPGDPDAGNEAGDA